MPLDPDAFKVEPWACDYVGMPYVANGRDVGHGPGQGVDCWGLVAHVMRQHYGHAIPDYDSIYETEAAHAAVAAEVAAASWTEVDFQDRAKGDGLWFRSLRGVAHVGVMVARNMFLHCNIGTEAALARATDPFWRSRLMGVYRWEGPTLE